MRREPPVRVELHVERAAEWKLGALARDPEPCIWFAAIAERVPGATERIEAEVGNLPGGFSNGFAIDIHSIFVAALFHREGETPSLRVLHADGSMERSKDPLADDDARLATFFRAEGELGPFGV